MYYIIYQNGNYTSLSSVETEKQLQAIINFIGESNILTIIKGKEVKISDYV